MTDFFKGLGLILAVLFGIFALGWAIQGNSFFMYQFFAPRQAAVERKVFENTPSYNQGMVQELENMEFQYEQADAAHKDALATLIFHRVAAFDSSGTDDKLPPDLRSFVNKLRSTNSFTR